jgi:exopolysaccharide biosynthesis protein
MVTLRIDPRRVRFEAHYRPNAPLSLQGWREALPDALAFVNANFFTPEHTVLGLLISDGTRYGQAYIERGGTFYQDASGNVGILENVRQALPSQNWRTAVQAFPMLVYDGAPTYANARDTRGSRRTVIAIDNEGRVLLMATPGIGLGLYPLSQFLPTAELGLVNAFNLDGGRSTMLWIQKTGYGIAPFEPVPSVLALYRRADAP